MPALFSNSTRLPGSPRSHLYSYWIFNERLRLKNDQLVRRQQTSCHVAFYSFCLCIVSGVMCVLIYRYTDQCAVGRLISFHCSRHLLFFGAICISCLACSGLLFGTCRYFRLQPHTIIHGHELHTIDLSNAIDRNYGTRIVPPAEEQSTVTELSSVSPQRKIPPFNYSECPL